MLWLCFVWNKSNSTKNQREIKKPAHCLVFLGLDIAFCIVDSDRQN